MRLKMLLAAVLAAVLAAALTPIVGSSAKVRTGSSCAHPHRLSMGYKGVSKYDNYAAINRGYFKRKPIDRLWSWSASDRDKPGGGSYYVTRLCRVYGIRPNGRKLALRSRRYYGRYNPNPPGKLKLVKLVVEARDI